MRVMDADVIIVGAGPTGLMLAGELRLAGVRPLVLERRPEPREIPRANGLGGQILQLLRYRGLLGRLEAASPNPHPAPIFPFGGVHLDLSHLADPPLQAMSLPQPQFTGQHQAGRARAHDDHVGVHHTHYATPGSVLGQRLCGTTGALPQAPGSAIR